MFECLILALTQEHSPSNALYHLLVAMGFAKFREASGNERRDICPFILSSVSISKQPKSYIQTASLMRCKVSPPYLSQELSTGWLYDGKWRRGTTLECILIEGSDPNRK